MIELDVFGSSQIFLFLHSPLCSACPWLMLSLWRLRRFMSLRRWGTPRAVSWGCSAPTWFLKVCSEAISWLIAQRVGSFAQNCQKWGFSFLRWSCSKTNWDLFQILRDSQGSDWPSLTLRWKSCPEKRHSPGHGSVRYPWGFNSQQPRLSSSESCKIPVGRQRSPNDECRAGLQTWRFLQNWALEEIDWVFSVRSYWRFYSWETRCCSSGSRASVW